MQKKLNFVLVVLALLHFLFMFLKEHCVKEPVNALMLIITDSLSGVRFVRINWWASLTCQDTHQRT